MSMMFSPSLILARLQFPNLLILYNLVFYHKFINSSLRVFPIVLILHNLEELNDQKYISYLLAPSVNI